MANSIKVLVLCVLFLAASSYIIWGDQTVTEEEGTEAEAFSYIYQDGEAIPVATSSGSSGVSYQDQLWLLSKAIQAEAEAEPYIGKVAVGAVLLNRVANSKFPNSLSGVVYQNRALESVSNGRMSVQPSASSRKAARDALNGWDPTYGSLYFWNPYKKVSKWIWTRKIVVQYGDHVFGK